VLLFQYHTWTPDGRPAPLPLAQHARGRVYWAPLRGFKKGAVDTRPKYLQQPGTGVRVYIAPNADWAPFWADAAAPLVVCEGEKKALALAARGLPAIALPGTSAMASAADRAGLCPELDRAAAGRTVYIVFDVDAGHAGLKPEVSRDALRLSGRLLNLEKPAAPRIVVLPRAPDVPLLAKWAVDDWLTAPAQRDISAEDLLRRLHAASEEHAAGRLLRELDMEYVYITELNAVAHRGTRHFYTVEGFRTAHNTREVALSRLHINRAGGALTTRLVPMGAGTAWLQYPGRSAAARAVFRPGCPDAVTAQGEFNTWMGWACVPLAGATRRDVAPFADALYLLHGPDDWWRMLLWYLYPLAYPQAGKQHVVPILCSESEGVGKSIIPQLLGRHVYGSRYFRQLHAESLKEPRLEFATECLFLLLDDMKSLARHDALLKHLATADTLQINEKYVRSRQVDNLMNQVITSNATKPLDITDETRRFAIPYINPAAKDSPQWPALAAWFASGAGGPAVLGFAQGMRARGEFDGYDRLQRAWRNARFEEMRELTVTDADRWVSDHLLRDAARDLVTFTELYGRFHALQHAAGATAYESSRAMLMKALNTVGRAMGLEKRVVPFYDSGRQQNHTVYALRNARHWLGQEHDVWRAETARCAPFKGQSNKKY
jgi:hypothetical protein